MHQWCELKEPHAPIVSRISCQACPACLNQDPRGNELSVKEVYVLNVLAKLRQIRREVNCKNSFRQV